MITMSWPMLTSIVAVARRSIPVILRSVRNRSFTRLETSPSARTSTARTTAGA